MQRERLSTFGMHNETMITKEGRNKKWRNEFSRLFWQLR